MLLDLDVKVEQQIYDIRVGYQVHNSKLGEVIRLYAEARFRISRQVAVAAGYRVLEYDTIEGEGDSRSGYDLRMSGAIVGLGISF